MHTFEKAVQCLNCRDGWVELPVVTPNLYNNNSSGFVMLKLVEKAPCLSTAQQEHSIAFLPERDGLCCRNSVCRLSVCL